MQLKELFTQLKMLAPNPKKEAAPIEPAAVDTHAVEADQTKDEEAQSKTNSAITSQERSKQKFALLQRYFQLSGQSSNPFLQKMMDHIEEELTKSNSITTTDSLNIGQSSIISFLDELITLPLEHELRLDSLRSELSINQQKNFAPENASQEKQKIPKKNKGEPKHIAIPEKFELPAPKQIKELELPNYEEIKNLKTGKIEVEVPTNLERNPDGIKATKQVEAKIDPEHPLISNKLGRRTESDYLADYGVKWDRTKCIRDLYQNFLDSHGLTLEGVTVSVSRENDSEPYKIRIEGLGEFNPEYVEKTGATTKKGALDTAGGFGEGAKILSLVLLRDHDVSKISFSSRNWKMDYHIGEFASGKDGLFRQLDLVEDREGNFLELTTDNVSLVEDLFAGLNLFYHPQNKDFNNATYENEVGGFKYLGRNVSGNAYPMRQRYQIGSMTNSKWDGGLDQISIWTNKKTERWSPDRDRTAIDRGTIDSEMINPIIKNMSDEDLMKSIRMLDEFWSRDLGYYRETPRERESFGLDRMSHGYNKPDPNDIGVAASMLRQLISEASSRNITTDFADNLLAIPHDGSKFPSYYLQQLQQRGFKFCATRFKEIGMKTAQEAWAELAEYKPLEPTEIEVRQINILKKAADVLRQKFIKSSFLMSEHDIAKPVYIFDRADKIVNKDAIAEFKGDHIYVDRSYLAHSSFENALATYLHEITHKYGGDETADFSYKLTDWLDICLKGAQDKDTAEQFADLKTLWSELVPEDVELQEDVRFMSGMVKSLSSSLPRSSLSNQDITNLLRDRKTL